MIPSDSIELLRPKIRDSILKDMDRHKKYITGRSVAPICCRRYPESWAEQATICIG